jgi:hypothetical protein
MAQMATFGYFEFGEPGVTGATTPFAFASRLKVQMLNEFRGQAPVGDLTGAGASTSIAPGTLSGIGSLLASSQITSEATGTLSGSGALAGTAASTSVMTGTLADPAATEPGSATLTSSGYGATLSSAP